MKKMLRVTRAGVIRLRDGSIEIDQETLIWLELEEVGTNCRSADCGESDTVTT